MSSLTDNGLCYSTTRRTGMRPAAFEANLAALGCQSIASSPYHPQTCGKIERFWQTLKKWLRARETIHGPHCALSALNAGLAVFAEHHNTRRSHRAHHGRTPAAVFTATVTARPVDRPLPATTMGYQTARQHRRHRDRQHRRHRDRRPLRRVRRRPLQTTTRHRHPRRRAHRDLHRHHTHPRPRRRPDQALPSTTKHSDEHHESSTRNPPNPGPRGVSDVLRQLVSVMSRDTTAFHQRGLFLERLFDRV